MSLDEYGVAKNQTSQFDGPFRGENGTPIAVLGQQRQASGVINMRMSDQDCVEIFDANASR